MKESFKLESSCVINSSRVRDFFQNRVEKFDSFYSRKEPSFWIILDYFFRRSMYVRFRLTLEECLAIESLRVLDIGCGPGRYAVALAKQGARFVTGIDFASSMIERAKILAKENKLEDKSNFFCADFLNFHFNEKFDVCLAIGFFDYTNEPELYLKKINSLCLKKAIFTFPAKWHLRTISRIIRLKFLNCPVYFYTLKKIKQLLLDNGFNNFKIRNIGRDYFVVVTV